MSKGEKKIAFFERGLAGHPLRWKDGPDSLAVQTSKSR
jgi:hypothetical protein